MPTRRVRNGRDEPRTTVATPCPARHQGAPSRPETARALTQDGKPQDGWVGPVSWAPDGKHFALWRERVVPIRQYTVVDSLTATKKDIPYDKPGDDKTERLPWVFAVSGEAASTPSREVLPLTMNTDRLDWTSDSRRLRSHFVKRGFTGHGIVEFSADTRRWRTLLVEEDPKFVFTYGSRYRHDLDENRTLWASERSGFNQLYLVDLTTGRTLNPVTSGPGILKQVVEVDAKSGELLYLGIGRGAGENPYQQHLYRTDLKGRPPLDLTPGDAHHAGEFSPGRKYFIDSASRVDLAPTLTLRASADGTGAQFLPAAKARMARGPKRYVLADPEEGAKQAVAEAWRNITATGAQPLAITDNMNFGNPEKPRIMGQFAAACRGMAAACTALDFPVVSGNVSLYNETEGRPILPTPAIGGVGVIEKLADAVGLAMPEGAALVLIGHTQGHLGQSLWLREIAGQEAGPPPPVNLSEERKNGDFVRAQILSGAVLACHDLSDGGLLVALAEMAMASGIGARITAGGDHGFWFGEDQARYILAVTNAQALLAAAQAAGVPALLLGQSGGASLELASLGAISIEELSRAHEATLPALMQGY